MLYLQGDSNEYTQYTILNMKKITLNYPKSAAMECFQGTQERVRNSRGKRAISIRATEVLLYLKRISSITATLLALFGGSLRIELHSSCNRTNRAIMLKSSCIRSMTCFSPKRTTLVWLILDYRDSKDSVQQTCWIVFAPCS